MTGYKRVNYYELCRLCTSSQPKDKIHIFREEGRKLQLQQKIQSCFPLLVCEHDYLPKVVCTTCIQILDQCFTFRQNCINSEAMLSSYFSNFRFTDDFKKAGKVYVKDTGQQKLENINQNNLNPPKKNVRDVPVSSTTNNVQMENNQQYFTLELPTIQTKPQQNFTKLVTTNQLNTQIQTNTTIKQQNSDFITLNTGQNNLINTTQHIKINQQNINNLSTEQQNLNCNQFNGNNLIQNNNKTTHFEQQKINNIDTSLLNNHGMMFVEMEQLNLAESEVNKLKEVLLKPIEFNKNKQINVETQKSETNNVLNNINNNNITNQNKNIDIINGIKYFKCDTCEKLFKRREHLYQHTKLHSGLRPFNCVHCPKTFSRKEHLIRHLTSHSGQKDYTCDTCQKKFSRPDNLKKHKKTHQKSGPFICEVCSKSFVIKHYYLAHKMQHHDNSDSNINNILKIDSGNNNIA